MSEDRLVELLSRTDFQTVWDNIPFDSGIDIQITVPGDGNVAYSINEAKYIMSYNWTLEDFANEYCNRLRSNNPLRWGRKK